MSCSTRKSSSLSAKTALHYILDLQPVFNTNFAKLFLSLLSKYHKLSENYLKISFLSKLTDSTWNS